MPANNPMGYIRRGRNSSRSVAAGRASSRSSGAGASGRLSRVTNYVKSNPKKSIMMGAGAVGAYGAVRGLRRTSGLDKTVGRSTGMYKY